MGKREPLADVPDNEYEAQRARIMARNRAKMEQLGLLQAVEDMKATRAAEAAAAAHHRTSSKRPRAPKAPLERRESARIRTSGNQVSYADAFAEPTGIRRRGKLGSNRIPLTVTDTSYAAPFTLRFTGTTIWDLGEIHRGEGADRYWSSAGCLYHHLYPVGFKATRHVFNREWTMMIEKGQQGPIFTVTDGNSGRVFTGTSPTQPWTAVCIAQATGMRISGPNFYGFSDVVTQRALANALYSEQELAQALEAEDARKPAQA